MSGAQDLVVIGGGEHARVVIEAARSRPGAWRVLGFTDPEPCLTTVEQLGVVRLGADEECLALSDHSLFILGVGAVGMSRRRRALVEHPEFARLRWATIVHAAAWISPVARLGIGVFVGAGAVVNTGAVIDDHCVVNSGAVLEHDVHLEPFVQIAPGAVLGGGTSIGSDSYVGLGACVRDHVRVGRRVMVAMGALVVGPIADDMTVAGVPARPFQRTKAHE